MRALDRLVLAASAFAEFRPMMSGHEAKPSENRI
jgi:hypothetical protein